MCNVDLKDAAYALMIDIYKIREVRELLLDCYGETEEETTERRNTIISLLDDVLDVGLQHVQELKAVMTSTETGT